MAKCALHGPASRCPPDCRYWALHDEQVARVRRNVDAGDLVIECPACELAVDVGAMCACGRTATPADAPGSVLA